MRIISGKARGTKLYTPPNSSRDIRPTSDRCKEALFSILADRISNARVLDLYAGTGALGLEALSRGAQSAVFVDNSKSSLAIIKKNSLLVQKSFTGIEGVPRILLAKCELPKSLVYVIRSIDHNYKPFDIIFLDPPYEKGFTRKTLACIDKNNLLAEQGIVVAEEYAKEALKNDYKTFSLFTTRRYGDTGFWFYESN